ncbi:MAG: oligosaccharide flippase family protein [Dorea sp.]|nr:oligosaccharide flippase family protein [Dorea sp.]
MLDKMRRLFNNRLAKSTCVYTISTFCNSAIPFIMLPVLTRYLTSEEYGVVSMFNATASFLVPFMGMSIGTAISIKLSNQSDGGEKEYIYNSLLVTGTSSMITSIIVMILAPWICQWTSIPLKYIPFILLYAVSMALCEAILSIFQIREQVKSYAIFQNVGTGTNLFLSIVLVVMFRMSLSGRICGMTFSKVIFACIAFLLMISYTKGYRKINKKYIKDVIYKFGFPMIPTVVKSTVLTYTDKIFITNMISVSETGIYAVGNQFSMPILILAQAFNLAYVPWLFRKLYGDKKSDKKKIVKLTYAYFVIILLIALIWTLLSIPIMLFTVGSSFVSSAKYIFWLSIGYAITGMHMMVVNYIYYAKKVNIYIIVTILVLVSNIVLNYIFIYFWGAIGAAQATLIANVISFLLTWILAAKVVPMPWFKSL